MANLTFELIRDTENVLIRELSIDVFSTFNLDDFATNDPLVYKTQNTIVLFPRTRQIRVKVRADASIGEGWQLKISINGVPIPEQPLTKTADNSGRANLETIITWVSALSAELVNSLVAEVSQNELKSLQKLIPEEDMSSLKNHVSYQNKAVKARKQK